MNCLFVETPKGDMENLFTYHSPTLAQLQQYARLRIKVIEFARVIYEAFSQFSDRTAFVRHLRETVMTANLAIAAGGGVCRYS